MRDSRHPVPFIVGTPRSGTTLLRAMLSSHPLLAIPPESHFLVQIFQRNLSVPGALDFVLAHERFASWQFHEAQARGIVQAEAPETTADLARLLYITYAARDGKERWGDKTPRYAAYVPMLASHFEESVFVNVVRDPRNVVASLLEQPWGPNTVQDAIGVWRTRSWQAEADGRELPDARYICIRYEDLTEQPEATLRAIIALVDLPWHDSMLRHRRAAERAKATSLMPRSHARLAEPIRTGIRHWDEDLASEDARLIERALADEMAYFGYLS